MPKNKARWFLAIATSISFSAILAQQSVPLIRSTSRLVLLDVIVTDKTGRPIRQLNKDDFTVLENGIPQTITSFEGVASVSSETSSPGIGSSATESAANNSRTIILLDQLNTSFADLASGRDNIVRFLDQDSTGNQLIALMSVGPHGLVIAQDYTNDHKRLKEGLLHLKAVNANPKGNMDINWAPEYAKDALGALTQIARASVGAPYGVNVIWVTSGFAGVVSFANRNDQLEEGLRGVTNLLIRSRMRLYTIDPAGVIPKIPMQGMAVPDGVSRGSELGAKESSADKLLNTTGTEAAQAEVLLSKMTRMMGGLSYYGRNDVAKALSQAVLDGSSAYVISYSPSNTNFQGEYRKIEVHVDLEGSTARTRPGYYAVADESADQQQAEVRLETAMSSPLVYSGIDVS
ncbi:MAG: VWA domain-containing protein, partial [Acidobacteriaceae bacterium]|nr:VWA domain-containing protein [Acidobacteriaceae bacterium]